MLAASRTTKRLESPVLRFGNRSVDRARRWFSALWLNEFSVRPNFHVWRFTMRIGSFAALGVLVLLTATSALGQPRARFDIPFEFNTGHAVLPAGVYDVTQSAGATKTVITCVHCKAAVFLFPQPVGDYLTPANVGKLVFNRYGSSYFLSSIWMPGSSIGGALPKSKNEKEAALHTHLSSGTMVVLRSRG